jgi:hypothetical protein
LWQHYSQSQHLKKMTTEKRADNCIGVS